MRKIITVVVLIALLFVGAFFLTQTVFKPETPQVTGMAILQKDKNGNELLTAEFTDLDSSAHFVASSPVFGGKTLEADLDAKSVEALRDVLDVLKANEWDALQEGQIVTTPAGGFAVVIQYDDGVVRGASSEIISPQMLEKVTETLSGFMSDLLSKRLGIDSGWLGDLLL